MYFNSGIWQKAVSLLKKAIEEGSSYDARRLLGSKVIANIIQADQDRDLEKTFNRAYRDACEAVASGCFFLNDQVCMRDYSELGRRATGGDEVFLVLSGIGLYQARDYDRALAMLAETMGRYPSSGAACFFTGMILKEKNDAPGFVRYLKRSKELGFNPERFLNDKKFPLRLY
jgi:hypothetical protein